MSATEATTEARSLIARIRSGNVDRADLDLAADLLERFTADHDEGTITYTLTTTEAAELTARTSEVVAEFRRVVDEIKAKKGS